MGKHYHQIGIGFPTKHILFHRAVAAAFHPEQARALLAKGIPSNHIVVDHIDSDSTNHRADNLQWTTQLSNMQFISGTQKRKRRRVLE